MLRLPAAVLLTLIGSAEIAIADPIEGRWKTEDATVAQISGCADSLCIVLKTGDYAGKEIGRIKPAGDGKYGGIITDPDDNKTYTGRAVLNGNELKLSGCALKIFCKTEIWSRISN